MLSAKACVPAQRDGIMFLTFTGVTDLLEPVFDASKVQIDLLIPIGQMLLQQLSKREFAIFKLSSMEVSGQKTVFVADALYRAPKGTEQSQAVEDFRAETEAACTVLGNRRPVKRKQKQIDAQDLPEILEFFFPHRERRRAWLKRWGRPCRRDALEALQPIQMIGCSLVHFEWHEQQLLRPLRCVVAPWLGSEGMNGDLLLTTEMVVAAPFIFGSVAGLGLLSPLKRSG